MARVDVIMPQMGESIAEGTVSRWIKKEGEAVKRDEAILEISTDKVDAEIPSPATGVLAEVRVPEGETVAVQTVIAVIDTEAAVGAAVAAPQPASPAVEAAQSEATAPAVTPASTVRGPASVEPAHSVPPETEPARAAPPPPPAPAATPAMSGETADERVRRRSTPLVRKIASEHGVDISRISGTGHAGRVTKQDILGYLETRPEAPERAPAPPPASVPAAPARKPVAVPPGVVEHPEVEAWSGDEVVPMSRIRKLTADHMVMSRRVSAHVTSFYEVDFTAIAGVRQRIKASYQERGANPTYLAFIVKVIAANLRKHRILNASVSGDSIIYRRPINIGVAVALDWGLIVPVLREADELSLLGIARKMGDLAERARTKRLSPDEVQQGTFTITNPGVFGSYIGAPIINQPQVAILGVGSIEKRPKVLTLENGQDVLAIRILGMLSLTYDHRIVDGADADRFMVDVKRDLEAFTEGAV